MANRLTSMFRATVIPKLLLGNFMRRAIWDSMSNLFWEKS